MKTEYIIIVQGQTDKFIEIVQAKLDAGWKLYGTPYGIDHLHCQAMTNTITPPPSRGTFQ